jgi:hypothetical protein
MLKKICLWLFIAITCLLLVSHIGFNNNCSIKDEITRTCRYTKNINSKNLEGKSNQKINQKSNTLIFFSDMTSITL